MQPPTEVGGLLGEFLSALHYLTIGLAFAVPFLRLCWHRIRRQEYPADRAVHDGIAAGALPSLLAMVFVISNRDVLTHIASWELFAAGLLAIFYSLAQLCSMKVAVPLQQNLKGSSNTPTRPVPPRGSKPSGPNGMPQEAQTQGKPKPNGRRNRKS